MKKKFTLFLCAVVLVSFLAGCNAQCEHSYTSAVTKAAYGFKEGTMTYTCEKCGHSYEEAIAATNTVKILMIGNSYSVDSSSYLWDVCTGIGLENVIVSNVWIPGSSIDDHWRHIQSGAAEYEYQKNTDGSFVVTPGIPLLQALTDEAWDAIVVTPNSSAAGQANSEINISRVMSWLQENKTNPNAEIFWNMTWAYPQNSDDSRFSYFEKDQMTMYNAVVSYVRENVEPLENVTGVIPTGTTIQNLRTSYLGDTMCRDSIHLSYTHGRFAAAVTVCAYVTGADASNLNQLPAMLEHLIANDLPVIRQAVSAALEKPAEVTQCDAQPSGK